MCARTYPSSEYLVDGGALLERALGDDFGPHLLHVEHKGVEWLFDDRLLGLLFPLGLHVWFPARGGGRWRLVCRFLVYRRGVEVPRC